MKRKEELKFVTKGAKFLNVTVKVRVTLAQKILALFRPESNLANQGQLLDEGFYFQNRI